MEDALENQIPMKYMNLNVTCNQNQGLDMAKYSRKKQGYKR